MQKYSDMWITKDTDGLYYISYVLPGAGHIRVKPFSFRTEDAAQRYVNNVFVGHNNI